MAKEVKESVDYSSWNIYKKMSLVKVLVQSKAINKSGRNTYAGWAYFDLKDFMPYTNEVMNSVGLFGSVDIFENVGTLTITNCDNINETLVYRMNIPEKVTGNKGNNEMQIAGSIDTYARRYLWIRALELCETDGFDIASDPNTPDSEKTTYYTKPRKGNVEDLMKELTTWRSNLSNIGIDVHSSDVSMYISQITGVQNLDHGALMQNPSDGEKVLKAYKAIYEKKKQA